MMKKSLCLAIAGAVLALAPMAQAAERVSGGLAGGAVGCCFGMRTAAAWNDGKKLHIHDILDLLWIGRIWSAIEGYGGTSTSDLHGEFPSYF
ncbi:MAG: hypothetical protein ACOX5G_03635 [Kiritimatiellia bacterium]|jgi:hypothetical protein